MRISTALLSFAAVWTLVGCPGPTFIVQQYSGPVRPREEVAILRSNAGDDTKLLYLDEADIAAPLEADSRLHIEMVPGRHSIVVGRASAPTERYRPVDWTAEPNHVYRVAFAGAEPRVYDVDRSKDTTLRDVTMDRPAPPPSVPPPAPVLAPPATPSPDADAGTPAE